MCNLPERLREVETPDAVASQRRSSASTVLDEIEWRPSFLEAPAASPTKDEAETPTTKSARVLVEAWLDQASTKRPGVHEADAEAHSGTTPTQAADLEVLLLAAGLAQKLASQSPEEDGCAQHFHRSPSSTSDLEMEKMGWQDWAAETLSTGFGTMSSRVQPGQMLDLDSWSDTASSHAAASPSPVGRELEVGGSADLPTAEKAIAAENMIAEPAAEPAVASPRSLPPLPEQVQAAAEETAEETAAEEEKAAEKQTTPQAATPPEEAAAPPASSDPAADPQNAAASPPAPAAPLSVAAASQPSSAPFQTGAAEAATVVSAQEQSARKAAEAAVAQVFGGDVSEEPRASHHIVVNSPGSPGRARPSLDFLIENIVEPAVFTPGAEMVECFSEPPSAWQRNVTAGARESTAPCSSEASAVGANNFWNLAMDVVDAAVDGAKDTMASTELSSVACDEEKVSRASSPMGAGEEEDVVTSSVLNISALPRKSRSTFPRAAPSRRVSEVLGLGRQLTRDRLRARAENEESPVATPTAGRRRRSDVSFAGVSRQEESPTASPRRRSDVSFAGVSDGLPRQEDGRRRRKTVELRLNTRRQKESEAALVIQSAFRQMAARMELAQAAADLYRSGRMPGRLVDGDDDQNSMSGEIWFLTEDLHGKPADNDSSESDDDRQDEDEEETLKLGPSASQHMMSQRQRGASPAKASQQLHPDDASPTLPERRRTYSFMASLKEQRQIRQLEAAAAANTLGGSPGSASPSPKLRQRRSSFATADPFGSVLPRRQGSRSRPETLHMDSMGGWHPAGSVNQSIGEDIEQPQTVAKAKPQPQQPESPPLQSRQSGSFQQQQQEAAAIKVQNFQRNRRARQERERQRQRQVTVHLPVGERQGSRASPSVSPEGTASAPARRHRSSLQVPRKEDLAESTASTDTSAIRSTSSMRSTSATIRVTTSAARGHDGTVESAVQLVQNCMKQFHAREQLQLLQHEQAAKKLQGLQRQRRACSEAKALRVLRAHEERQAAILEIVADEIVEVAMEDAHSDLVVESSMIADQVERQSPSTSSETPVAELQVHLDEEDELPEQPSILTSIGSQSKSSTSSRRWIGRVPMACGRPDISSYLTDLEERIAVAVLAGEYSSPHERSQSLQRPSPGYSLYLHSSMQEARVAAEVYEAPYSARGPRPTAAPKSESKRSQSSSSKPWSSSTWEEPTSGNSLPWTRLTPRRGQEHQPRAQISASSIPLLPPPSARSCASSSGPSRSPRGKKQAQEERHRPQTGAAAAVAAAAAAAAAARGDVQEDAARAPPPPMSHEVTPSSAKLDRVSATPRSQRDTGSRSSRALGQPLLLHRHALEQQPNHAAAATEHQPPPSAAAVKDLIQMPEETEGSFRRRPRSKMPLSQPRPVITFPIKDEASAEVLAKVKAERRPQMDAYVLHQEDSVGDVFAERKPGSWSREWLDQNAVPYRYPAVAAAAPANAGSGAVALPPMGATTTSALEKSQLPAKLAMSRCIFLPAMPQGGVLEARKPWEDQKAKGSRGLGIGFEI